MDRLKWWQIIHLLSISMQLLFFFHERLIWCSLAQLTPTVQRPSVISGGIKDWPSTSCDSYQFIYRWLEFFLAVTWTSTHTSTLLQSSNRKEPPCRGWKCLGTCCVHLFNSTFFYVNFMTASCLQPLLQNFHLKMFFVTHRKGRSFLFKLLLFDPNNWSVS